MKWENLLLSKEDRLAILSINRPQALNALNIEVLNELNGAIDLIEKDDDISVLIITGEGRAFVAGADIGEMKDMKTSHARAFAKKGIDLFRKIELMEKPVIAAINGFALGGGCELSMACDIRIASEKAKFGQPEVGLGITPGFGGTQRLARIVGIGKAKELIYTGQIIDAQEAYRIGLVNQLVEANDLISSAKTMAGKIIANGEQAVAYAKSAINRGIETDIETGMAIEMDLFSLCFSNDEQKDRMEEFLRKK